MRLIPSLLLVIVSLANWAEDAPPATPDRMHTSQQDAIAAIEKLRGGIKLNKSGKVISVNWTSIKVTDAGLVHLKGLTDLQRLNLNRTNVTDTGLVHLQGLTNLKLLQLRSTKVTDAGLVHLKRLTKLRMLDLVSTEVTAAGVKELKAALPECQIYLE